jgi:hypothetical protein
MQCNLLGPLGNTIRFSGDEQIVEQREYLLRGNQVTNSGSTKLASPTFCDSIRLCVNASACYRNCRPAYKVACHPVCPPASRRFPFRYTEIPFSPGRQAGFQTCAPACMPSCQPSCLQAVAPAPSCVQACMPSCQQSCIQAVSAVPVGPPICVQVKAMCRICNRKSEHPY